MPKVNALIAVVFVAALLTLGVRLQRKRLLYWCLPQINILRNWLFLSRYYNNCVLFFSGKILETLSPKHLPSSLHHLGPLSLTVRPPPSPPSQPPTPPRTPLSPPHHKSSGSPLPTHHAQHQQTSGQSSRSSPHTPQMAPQSLNQHGEHQAAAVYESIRHKMANSMAKLAGLPPDSIIGNPRVSNRKAVACSASYRIKIILLFF